MRKAESDERRVWLRVALVGSRHGHSRLLRLLSAGVLRFLCAPRGTGRPPPGRSLVECRVVTSSLIGEGLWRDAQEREQLPLEPAQLGIKALNDMTTSPEQASL